MIKDIQKDADKRMKKSVEAIRTDLARIRTGRASPALLDHLSVDYYGSTLPISQVATVAVGALPRSGRERTCTSVRETRSTVPCARQMSGLPSTLA